MEYKGYHAKVEFVDDADIFHGEVVNLRDVITFEGETVQQLKRAFQDSVDDYLDFCAKRGEDPENKTALHAGLNPLPRMRRIGDLLIETTGS